MKVCSYISGQCSPRTQRGKEDRPEKDTNFMGEALQLADLRVSLFNQRCHIRLARARPLQLVQSRPLHKPHQREDPVPSQRTPNLRCWR